MRKIKCFLPLIIGGSLLYSCKKDKTNKDDCFPGTTTSRVIVNKPATVKQQPGGVFYIIEQGTIDQKLLPCNLPAELQVDNLLVNISGEVKALFQGGPGPCCTDGFFITKISK